MPQVILGLYIVLSVIKQIISEGLAWLNFTYFRDAARLASAAKTLGMTDESVRKAAAYAFDKFRFSRIVGNVSFLISVIFIAVGGLGMVEQLAILFAMALGWTSQIAVGLLFFAIIGVVTYLVQLPSELYYTFIIEQKHGFNKQTLGGFFGDQIKSMLLSVVIGGVLLSAIMWAIAYFQESWWLWVWGLMIFFSLLMAWIFPTFLAPLFNKFSPLGDAALQQDIDALADKVGFKSKGVYVMDASKRSSHANAYFTGVFGAKRIVLFDTLLKHLSREEIVAVLGHELGHFALKHIIKRLLVGSLLSGIALYAASWFAYDENLYHAFGMTGFTVYGALTMFSLWSGLFGFLTQPLMTHWSRVHEFEADQFAKNVLQGRPDDLMSALKKLRETSHSLPVVHPWYSAFYYSHPPLLERLEVLGR